MFSRNTFKLIYIGFSLLFLFTCEQREFVEFAAVKTGQPIIILARSATLTGSIVDIGGGIQDYGHCWAISSNPTVTDNKSGFGSTMKMEVFKSDINELNPGITYYFRSYVITNGIEIYGDIDSFETMDGQASVTTTDVSQITEHTAQSGGNVNDAGGDTVTGRGICWDTDDSFNLRSCSGFTNNGESTGRFNALMTDLSAATKYYVKAYSITTVDTTYGNSIEFTTRDGLPTLTTFDISDITAISAICGGNISNAGVASVTDRGVCWNLTGEPTIMDTKTENGGGTGSFTSVLSGLAPNQTFYVRAYATNSYGTKYAEDERNFTTLDGIVTLATDSVTNITKSSAISGGEITDDGGSVITARGVCWNTTGTPTVSDNKTTNGTGTGSFTSSITGLIANVNYYVRAYATNSVDTYYGDERTFTAKEIVTDFDGNQYDIITIGSQTWMAENLKVTHYPDGTQIPYVTGYSNWAALGDNNMDDAYCWYNNDETTYKNQYGALYTFAAAFNACPAGWHLPTDTEWTELENYLIANGYNWDGTTLLDKTGKALAATTGWESNSEAGNIGNDQGSNNSTGFTALPSGYRSANDGSFYYAGRYAIWWGYPTASSSTAYIRYLINNLSSLYRSNGNKSFGYSVRCLRD